MSAATLIAFVAVLTWAVVALRDLRREREEWRAASEAYRRSRYLPDDDVSAGALYYAAFGVRAEQTGHTHAQQARIDSDGDLAELNYHSHSGEWTAKLFSPSQRRFLQISHEIPRLACEYALACWGAPYKWHP